MRTSSNAQINSWLQSWMKYKIYGSDYCFASFFDSESGAYCVPASLMILAEIPGSIHSWLPFHTLLMLESWDIASTAKKVILSKPELVATKAVAPKGTSGSWSKADI